VKKRLILLVCGGNTSRSPMAKVILQQMLMKAKLDDMYEVDSAGIKPDGKFANQEAKNVIINMYGRDLLANHVPKQLTSELGDRAYLIMVMQSKYEAKLQQNKVKVLGITDPHGHSYEAYEACAQKLILKFQKLWPDITGNKWHEQNMDEGNTNPIAGRNMQEKEQSPSSPSPSPLNKKIKDTIKAQVIPITEEQHNRMNNKIFEDVERLAEGLDYGRGRREHAKTVTNYMMKLYSEMVKIGLISDSIPNQKLAHAIGLSHDIGYSIGSLHHETGFEKLKEKLWRYNLSPIDKSRLAIIMYGVYYHTSSEHLEEGKLNPVDDIPLKDDDYPIAAQLVAMIRVADGLDHYLDGRFADLQIVRTSQGIECRVTPRVRHDPKELLKWVHDNKRDMFEAKFGTLSFWRPIGINSWIRAIP